MVIYDPEVIQVSFQTPNAYPISCETIAPLYGEIPNLAEVKIESRPKLLLVAFPPSIRSGKSTTGALAFADLEDDLVSLYVNYRSADGAIRDSVSLPLTQLPFGSPYGPGLKLLKFEVQIECRRGPINFQAQAFAGDKTNQQSEPLSFTFSCDR